MKIYLIYIFVFLIITEINFYECGYDPLSKKSSL